MKYHFVLLMLLALLTSGCRSSVVEPTTPSQVSILFTVAQPSHVTITIANSYNIVVKTPFKEDMWAATFMTYIDSSDLPAGIYFFTVECKGMDGVFYSKAMSRILITK